MANDTIKINVGGKSFHLSKQDFEDAKDHFVAPDSEEGKKIEMAMTVDTSAEYATNATEYFRKCLIGEDKSRSKMRPVLGVKELTKLGGLDASSVDIKPGAVEFDPDDTTATQKEYRVNDLMWGTLINVNELEQAYMSDQLKKGSNNFSDKFEFMNFFYSEVSRRVDEQMEIITFTGVLATNGVDGLETKMAADTNVLKPTVGNGGVASAIDDTNVIAKLKQARDVVPKAIRKKSDFTYIVSQDVYDALADVVSENKASGLYYIEGTRLTFQGREIYLADGASDNTIICTYWENLLNIQDMLSDELGFNVVDFMGTTLARKIGVRADFKFEPNYVNAEEIYFHTFA